MSGVPGETVNLAHQADYALQLDIQRKLFKNRIGSLVADSSVPSENRWFVS